MLASVRDVAVFREACAAGRASACAHLCVAQELGLGVAPSVAAAATACARVVALARDDGGATASATTAWSFRVRHAAEATRAGLRGADARQALERACDDAHGDACLALADACAHGRAGPRDADAAATLRARACELGVTQACDDAAR